MAFFDTIKNFFGGIGDSVGQGLLNFGTTAYNIFSNERQFKEQQKLNQQAIEMENTATSRALQDARNAGLSTAQWLSMNGAQFGSPSLSTGGTQMVNAPDVQSPTLRHIEAQRAMNQLAKEEAMLDAQIESVNLDNEQKRAEINATTQGTELNRLKYDETVRQFNDEMSLKNLQLSETQRHNLMSESLSDFSNKLNLNSQKRQTFETFMLYGNSKDTPVTIDLGDGYTATVPAGFAGLKNITSDWDISRIQSQIAVDNASISKMEAETWSKYFLYNLFNTISEKYLNKPLDSAILDGADYVAGNKGGLYTGGMLPDGDLPTLGQRADAKASGYNDELLEKMEKQGFYIPDEVKMKNTVSSAPSGLTYSEGVSNNPELKKKADQVMLILRKEGYENIADQFEHVLVYDGKLYFRLKGKDESVTVPVDLTAEAMYWNIVRKF